jgi:hypothetical protein
MMAQPRGRRLRDLAKSFGCGLVAEVRNSFASAGEMADMVNDTTYNTIS